MAKSGLLAAPKTIAGPECRQYTVQAVGRIEVISEQLYAITTGRRLPHPAIVAVVRATQREFFGKPERAGAHRRGG